MSRNHQKQKTTATTPIACNNRCVNQEDTGFTPSFSFYFLTSNGIGAMYRAYSRGDNYTIAFVLSLCIATLLLEWCVTAYQRLPPRQESRKKEFLKTGIWGLTTMIYFGLLYQFAPYFSLAGVLSAYAVAIACSACVFYLYFICDDKNGSSGCCSDEKVTSSQCCSAVEGATDKNHEHSISILDKV
ncbi:hypothetical protein L1049_002086 [Liquidambar formosana]|uniref:Uncharacterized protein n=1 Tax=Liquidambar formosana TaxID=63359 RepID=A0AAP0R8N2_LIQFO